jgi:hypothetical protein
MQPRYPEHETKGVWFIAAKTHLEEALPASRYDTLLASLPPAYREVVESPLASEWYPEDAAASLLQAWLAIGAEGDKQRFTEMIAQASEAGVGRFFRAIATIASPRFLLRRTPTIFKQMRRGPAQLTVEDRDVDVVARYVDFPFLEDEVYALCFPAQLGVLARTATGTPVRTRILEHTRSSLTVSIELL